MRSSLAILLAVCVTTGACAAGDESDELLDVTPSGKADGSGNGVLKFNKSDGYVFRTASFACNERLWCDATIKFQVDGWSAGELARAAAKASPDQTYLYPMVFMVSVDDEQGNSLLPEPVFVELQARREASGEITVTNSHAVSNGGAVDVDGVVQLTRLAPRQKVFLKTYWVNNFLTPPIAGAPEQADLYLAVSWN